MIETILIIYFSIAGISLFGTFFWLIGGEDIEGMDNYWDWIVYNLFWIIQPIKSIIKLFKNL
jgi:hypothetical protein